MSDKPSNQCAYCGYEGGKHNYVCVAAENERLRAALQGLVNWWESDAGRIDDVLEVGKAALANSSPVETVASNPANFDVATDTLTIFSVKYAVSLFKTLGLGPIGGAFRIIGRSDGVVTLQALYQPDETVASNQDSYDRLTLLCRLLDVLWWAHYATDTDSMGAGHRERGRQMVSKLIAIYGERRYLPVETTANEGFQARVHDWMAQCFVRPDAMLPAQRSFRFTEEALELAQASGTSREDVMRLVDYVFGRSVGAVDQEIGGVVVTLAGLANSVGLSVEYAGNAELARCVENTAKIRAKDLAKPQRSPLPGSPEEPAAHTNTSTGPTTVSLESPHDKRSPEAADIASGSAELCEGCPPIGYPTDKTRCAPCPRRAEKASAPVYNCPVTHVDCIRNCAPTRCAIADTP